MKEDENKMSKRKKFILWLIGAIIISVIISIIIMNNKNTTTNNSNNLSNISDNTSLSTNIELSDISYSGARFKITYSDLKKKCSEAGIQEYEIESKIRTYNDDVTTDMWCFKGYRTPTLEERAIVGTTPIGFDAYYFKITYENSTQMVVEIQLIGLIDVDNKIKNQMYKNYSILLGCIDSNIYDNAVELLGNASEKGVYALKDNIFYNLYITQQFGDEAICILTVACSEEEFQYMENNNGIWQKQNNNTNIQEDTSNYYEHPAEWYEQQDEEYENNNLGSSTVINNNSNNSNNSTSPQINNNNNSSNNNNNDSNSQEETETTITMPNLIGLTTKQAEQKLLDLGIQYKVKTITSLTKENVFYQSVSAGTNKTAREYGVITIKTYNKLSTVNAFFTVNSSNNSYIGKPIKVVFNDEQSSGTFGNTGYFGSFFIKQPNVSVKVYIDDVLVKSQEINLDKIAETDEISSKDIGVTINI